LLINILNTTLYLPNENLNSEQAAHSVRLHWDSPAIFNWNVGRGLTTKISRC